MAGKVAAPGLGLVDHRREAIGLVTEVLDLAVDAVEGIDEDRPPLAGIRGGAEAFAVAFARRFVLEQLADLGEGEAGVVAQAPDETQPLDVRLVVEAVGALGAGGGLQEPDFLVIADGPWRQADLGGDLLDAQESGIVRRQGRLGRRHRPILRQH